MVAASAHYLLYCDIEQDSTSWHFRLESVAGRDAFDVADSEADIDANRLALLALVRGLEALDQPSRVTLVTSNAYLRRGLVIGLPDWRQTKWRWERFGRMVPVKNADLWQRVDRALHFHELDARIWRIDRVDSNNGADPSASKVPRPRFLDRAKSHDGDALVEHEPLHETDSELHDQLAAGTE